MSTDPEDRYFITDAGGGFFEVHEKAPRQWVASFPSLDAAEEYVDWKTRLDGDPVARAEWGVMSRTGIDGPSFSSEPERMVRVLFAERPDSVAVVRRFVTEWKAVE